MALHAPLATPESTDVGNDFSQVASRLATSSDLTVCRKERRGVDSGLCVFFLPLLGLRSRLTLGMVVAVPCCRTALACTERTATSTPTRSCTTRFRKESLTGCALSPGGTAAGSTSTKVGAQSASRPLGGVPCVRHRRRLDSSTFSGVSWCLLRVRCGFKCPTTPCCFRLSDKNLCIRV